ncbi:uncharacterized protein K02A2.6-like isoform X2 [Xenopus laevis]|uniref:Uncharacterized protein K02A2.6-like isoform X2 n=1 Tax=Xenopus laevis TaxID=8355 RepID=A0A8J1LHD2_XENLA|nr:uncharacterized protein K02A2.6-like isoform X2 [Xenopus laevis]
MPKRGPHEYALVCVDMFSSWTEAWPVKNANAVTTAKKILSEVPEAIESDQGTHFTGQVFKEICEALHINQGLHTPYHPQSSGKVERLNGTLKNKIAKISADTGKPWPECLSIVLYSVHNAPKRPHGLSPYEILFGSRPKTGLYFPQQLSSLHSQLKGYVQSLQRELQKIHHRVHESIPDPESITGLHSIQPGDWVVITKYQRQGLEARYTRPYQVLLTTSTSLKVEERDGWIHASHCKKLLDYQVQCSARMTYCFVNQVAKSRAEDHVMIP